MLRLEKTSPLSGLMVRVRERERFFEPRLLKALTIALLLHCGGLILFQVTPFSVSSTFIFSPIQVQSDHPLQSVSALASSYTEEEEFFPPITLIPALAWIDLSPEPIVLSSKQIDIQAFKSIEEHLWPKWNVPLSLQLEEPRIQLAISGELAKLALIATDPLLHHMQPLSPELSPTYVTYEVQVDESTGELFWYDRTVSSGIPSIDSLTEKILLNLRFSSVPSQEIVTGTLNFVVLDSELTLRIDEDDRVNL